jgi:hypothetical protein
MLEPRGVYAEALALHARAPAIREKALAPTGRQMGS